MAFVDLQKAYDSVNRGKLWKALVEELKMPSDIVQIVRNMYIESRGVIKKGGDGEEVFFSSNKGVKQGDGASPKIFSLFFDRCYN